MKFLNCITLPFIEAVVTMGIACFADVINANHYLLCRCFYSLTLMSEIGGVFFELCLNVTTIALFLVLQQKMKLRKCQPFFFEME